MWQVEVSHKSEMAGPFNRGDTIINKHFTLLLFIPLLMSAVLSKNPFKMSYLQSFFI